MKKNKRGAHYAETSKSKKHWFILFLIILIVIFIVIYFLPKENHSQSTLDFETLKLSDSYPIENYSDLTSKNFSIDESEGISEIKGTIENTSDKTLENLNFIYSLLDDSNNIVYEFKISISKLNAHNSSSFSSVCILDLSSVTSYSVKLAE